MIDSRRRRKAAESDEDEDLNPKDELDCAAQVESVVATEKTVPADILDDSGVDVLEQQLPTLLLLGTESKSHSIH